MNTPKPKSDTLKTILIIIIGLVIIITIGLLSYNKYHNYKVKKAAEQVQIDNNIKLEADKSAKIKAEKQAKFDADVRRLVSICLNEQQRYDLLTVKLQELSTRPDCTISQQ